MSFVIHQGDALTVLRGLPEASVNCCITSPPYFGLRDYGTGQWQGGDAACDHKYNHGIQGASGDRATRTHTAEAVYKDTCGKCGAIRVDNQIGLERTYPEYIARLVDVFREVRRVLRGDGTCWVNMGDSYSSGGREGHGTRVGYKQASNRGSNDETSCERVPQQPGLKPKDLLMIPARLAIALQEDGWYLRSDIVWAKPAPMPESVEDRPTRSHEFIYLLTKSEKYWYDHEAIKEETVCGHPSGNGYKRDSRLTYQDGDGPRGSDEPWRPSKLTGGGLCSSRTESTQQRSTERSQRKF